MTVTFIPPQEGSPDESSIPYTGNPFALCWHDILLFFELSWSLVGILHPWNQWDNKELDELYPYSIPNLVCLALHGFLIVLQLAFLASLPFLLLVPVGTAMLYVTAVMLVNYGVCRVLNGGEDTLKSKTDLGGDETQFENECWIYLNGVSVGQHWLQNNLERLSFTFRRPIIGVHNRTYGIVFDLIQCIIERNFCYATDDIRTAHALVKGCLIKENYKRVVFILHSQGGIEGGLILDWLLSELPHDTLQKLEIYTFGCAANHFNNPHRSSAHMAAAKNPNVTSLNDKAVRHIEHYGNDGDFVARWGVLHYTRVRNRYMGRVFIRSGMGHLLNQHYLNSMFPLDENKRVIERNSFTDCDVTFSSEGATERAKNRNVDDFWNGGNNDIVGAIVEDTNSPVEPVNYRRAESLLAGKGPKVRHFSRLWEYRNGGSPES